MPQSSPSFTRQLNDGFRALLSTHSPQTMSITGGNFINKLALNLHYRVVFLQLQVSFSFNQTSRKNGVVLRCSQGKGYSSSSSSSVPVRYIPKKSTRTENADITSSGSCNKNQNSSRDDAPQNGMLSSSEGHVEGGRNTDGSKSSGREDGIGGRKRWSYFSIDLNSGSGEKNFGHLGVATSASVEGTRDVSKNGDIAFVGDRDQLGVVQREGMSNINASNMFGHETLHDEQNADSNFVYGKNSNIRSQKGSEIDVQVGVSTCEFDEGTRGFVKDVDVAYGGDEEQQEASTRGGMSTSMSASKMFRHETIPEELNAPNHHFLSKSSNAISRKSSDTSPVDKIEWTREINGHLRVATSKLVEEPKKVEDGGGKIEPQCEISCDTRALDGKMVSGNKDYRRSEKKSNNISRSVRPDSDEQTSHSLKDMNEETDHEVLVDIGFMEEPEEDIENSGAFNHTEDFNSPAYRKTKQDVENMVVQFLAKRAFTAVELRKKLTAKSFPLAAIENVIHDFQKRGLINDRLYAESYSQSRWSTSSWGPRKIKQELGMKGISQADVTRAVKLVFEDDETGGESSRINLSRSSLERLYAQAYKKWLQCQNVPWEKRKARIVNWLQYRGFNWDVISIILKKLESQQSP